MECTTVEVPEGTSIFSFFEGKVQKKQRGRFYLKPWAQSINNWPISDCLRFFLYPLRADRIKNLIILEILVI